MDKISSRTRSNVYLLGESLAESIVAGVSSSPLSLSTVKKNSIRPVIHVNSKNICSPTDEIETTVRAMSSMSFGRLDYLR